MKKISEYVNTKQVILKPTKEQKVDKLKNIWEMLTAKYGNYELKAGQSMAVEKQLWMGVLGDYKQKDILDAVTYYMKNDKKDEWPNAPKILHTLRDWSCEKDFKKEKDALALKKEAASDWYHEKFLSVYGGEVSQLLNDDIKKHCKVGRFEDKLTEYHSEGRHETFLESIKDHPMVKISHINKKLKMEK